jgi:heme/copper-type cytochrome/quinol oxidase subunit 2
VSRNARILAIVGTLVVLVVVFVVLSPGDDSDKSTTTTVAAPPPAAAGTTSTPAVEPAPPAPTYTTVTVRGGKPVGGIKKITVSKGDRVRIQVTSPDTSDEIHLHGYDLKRDLKAGGSVRFSFVASTDGIYEIELEGASEQIASLVVEP